MLGVGGSWIVLCCLCVYAVWCYICRIWCEYCACSFVRVEHEVLSAMVQVAVVCLMCVYVEDASERTPVLNMSVDVCYLNVDLVC